LRLPNAKGGIPELARMPHALDPEVGFRVRIDVHFRGLHPGATRLTSAMVADVLITCPGSRMD